MTLDHVFMLIDSSGRHIEQLRGFGLRETYRRKHLGQGTQNVCFCFDNLFLELLWVDDPAAVRSEAIARMRLHERSLWQTEGTNPFGIAWRDAPGGSALQISTWVYKPPYLPPGMQVDVATDSDDPQQPMMFRSPGTTSPIEWLPEKRGALQHEAGFGRVLGVSMAMPERVTPSKALKALEAETELQVRESSDDHFSIALQIERMDSAPPTVLRLTMA